MKKILFILLMVVGLMSSLYALDTSQVGCDVEKSQTLIGCDGVKTTPVDITYTKVNILHKDSLMYSWGEGIDNKIPGISGGYKQNINIASAIVAVVCYPRGGFGA